MPQTAEYRTDYRKLRLVSPRSLSLTPGWVLVIVLHITAFSYGLYANELISAVATASLAIFIGAWYSLARKSLIGMSLVLAFLCGCVLAFDYANWGYVQFTARFIGENHELTAWMGSLLAWSALIGGICSDIFLGSDAPPHRTNLVTAETTIRLGMIIFVFTAVLYVLAGNFTARYAPIDFPKISYLFWGIYTVGYIFFFLLGTRMKGSITSPRNLKIMSFVIGTAFVAGLSGGREISLMMCMYLLLGAATFGDVGRVQLGGLGAFFFAIGVIFVIVVGIARVPEFGDETLSNRAKYLTEVAKDLPTDSGDDPLAKLFERLFEDTGRSVIDITARSGRYAGFEGIDALVYVFVPRFIAPDKPDIDNATVILERDFGYNLRGNRVPLTIIGDAYRRGGESWVLVTGLLAGIAFRLLTRTILLIVRSEFGLMALALCAPICLRAYTDSVFGLINLILYMCMKQLAFVILFAAVARRLALRRQRFR